MEPTTVTALWWAVIVSGIYHGVNPGMGWPLSVTAALMARNAWALPKALLLLAFGHLLAMLAILLPFSALTVLVQWQREIQLGAACVVIAMGIYLLINRRHPRFLARVHPARLALWSFLAALAHGAGLMLVPIYLGLCQLDRLDPGHAAAMMLMNGAVMTAFWVAVVHTLAMTLSGGVVALLIYRWLGLQFLSRTWFNLDIVWALSLIVVGLMGIAFAH